MECFLNKDKIKEAIHTSVKDVVTSNEALKVDGEVITFTKAANLPLTPEQTDLIDKSLQYADEISGVYRASFKTDPERFLREIAEQANSSGIEQRGALNAAGINLFDIATTAFPEQGLVSQSQKDMIDAINAPYKTKVLIRDGEGKYKIEVPDALVLKYLAKQTGGKEAVLEVMRQNYLSQFSENSLNLMDENMWLHHPILANPNIQTLLNYVRKINPNFRVAEIEGLDQKGVALIRDRMILIGSGLMLDELPEEVAHFFIELLPDDNELKIRMLKEVLNYPIYQETVRRLKNNPVYQKEDGKPDYDKIKREAAAKLLSQHIKDSWENTLPEEEKKSKIRSIISDFIKFLRKIFATSISKYSEPLVSVRSAFSEAVGKIEEGNITDLNIRKIPTNYDSIFFSEVEKNIDELGYPDICKAFSTVAKGMRKNLQTLVYDKILKEDFRALKEILDDDQYKNYNKVFGLTEQALDIIKSINEEFTGTPEEKRMNDILKITKNADSIAEVFREMEMIPKAIEEALSKMKANGSILGVMDNMRELQGYFQFSEAFKTIMEDYNGLLGYINSQEGKDGLDVKDIYERMIKGIGQTQTRFNAVDETIMRMLKDHVLKLMVKWTEVAFTKYTGDKMGLMSEMQTVRWKVVQQKLLVEKITSPEQLRQVIMGQYPLRSEAKLLDGSKADLSRLRDMSQLDYLISLFSSPSLVSDPFISNLMAFFTDEHVKGVVRGGRDSKRFVDSILPIKKKLEALGVGHYASEKAIHQREKFYDPEAKDKTIERLAFLSETNRHDFNHQKQIRYEAYLDSKSEVDRLKKQFHDNKPTGDEAIEAKKILTEKEEVSKAAKKEYDDLINNFSHRPFTDEFYEIVKLLKKNDADSKVLKDIKDVNVLILDLEEKLAVLIGQDAMTNEVLYENFSAQLTDLQTKKGELRRQLPATEEIIYETMEKLYERDIAASERLQARHKARWIRNMVKITLADSENKLSESQVQTKMGNLHDTLFNVSKPTQEFYDKRTAIFDKIGEAAKTSNNADLIFITDRIKVLEDKKRDIIKDFRNLRSGDVNVNSFKYSDYDAENMTSEVLKGIEEEVDALRKKQNIYAALLSSAATPQQKENIKSYAEMLGIFNQILRNPIITTAQIIELFKPLASLTSSQAEQIKDAIAASKSGDHSALQSLSTLPLTLNNDSVKYAWSIMKFTTASNMTDMEANVLAVFKELVKQDSDLRDTIDGLYKELDDLYVKGVTFDYVNVMREFISYHEEYLNSKTFDHPLKEDHGKKYEKFNPNQFFTQEAIENFLGDGVFEATILYLEHKSGLNRTDNKPMDIERYIRFITSIHKMKTVRTGQDTYTTFTPVQYNKKPIPGQGYEETVPPKFLTRNKIRDSFITEKVNELDPRVQSGEIEANVDINGQFLPKNDPTSPFYNERYAALKNGTDEVSKLQFEMLQKMRFQYLTKQAEILEEGRMLDTVLPSKQVDDWEAKVLFVTNAKDTIADIKNVIPFLNQANVEQELMDNLQDAGAITAENRDIYTGRIISEKRPKLYSMRRIPIQRQSVDATAAIALFFEEIGTFEAKDFAGPVFKTFADVFEDNHHTDPKTNKNRSEGLRALYSDKILGEKPDNFFNNQTLSLLLNTIGKSVALKLIADPFGAIVNLTSGAMQNLIETEWGKEAYANYVRASLDAFTWSVKYTNDLISQNSWSRETQIITVFNMLPDRIKSSQQLSKMALFTDFQAIGMGVRSVTENQVGIQLGSAILYANAVMINGKKVEIEDLYDVDKVTGLLKVKDEYISLDKEWNPVDGTEVVRMRRLIMQKYTLLQGNFFDVNSSYASTTAVGKAMEMMKKWAFSGILRRWQPETIDPYTGEARRGFHLVMLELMNELIYSARKGTLANMADWKTTYDKNQTTKAGIRKSISEMVLVFVFAMITTALGYDDDDEKTKNQRLREASWLKQAAILMTVRVQSELGTFIPVPLWGLGYSEMSRMILDPMAITKGGFNNIVGAGNLLFSEGIYRLGMDDSLAKKLTYSKDQGYDSSVNKFLGYKGKGDSKLWALLLNTVGYSGYTADPEPYIKVINNLQNRVK